MQGIWTGRVVWTGGGGGVCVEQVHLAQRKNQPVKDLATAVQRLELLVPADEKEQGPPEALEPRGRPNQGLADVHCLSKAQGQPHQKGFADNHLPAQVGSLAPILGKGQEKKEEFLPGFSRCRPSS